MVRMRSSIIWQNIAFDHTNCTAYAAESYDEQSFMMKMMKMIDADTESDADA